MCKLSLTLAVQFQTRFLAAGKVRLDPVPWCLVPVLPHLSSGTLICLQPLATADSHQLSRSEAQVQLASVQTYVVAAVLE